MATKKAPAEKTAAKKAPAKKAVAKKAVGTKAPANEEALGTTHEAAAAEPKRKPTHDDIAKLAHKYWEQRGHHHGSHHDDWLRAIKELGGE